MSPKKSDTINLSQGAKRTLTVDGHKFTAGMDDVAILRDLFTLGKTIREFTEPYDGTSDPEPILEKLLTLTDDAKRVIDSVLGQGAYVTLFDDAVPIVRALSLVAALEKMAGESYDEMFREFAPN